MPSDTRTERASKALAGPLGEFRAALDEAIAQLRGDLENLRDGENVEETPSVTLGPFALGRIDPARFAALVQQREPVDLGTRARIQDAHARLAEMAKREDPPWIVDVPPGGDLRPAVSRALDDVGRVFAAARTAELSRKGRYDDRRHGDLAGSLSWTRWTRGERELAPPLLVHVDGRDLRAAGLADFLEGSLKIVLVVRGDAPPAPLVRLVSPGILVLQTDEPDDLDRLTRWSGPAVAALLPDSAARFVHDPAGGEDLSDRLTVHRLPDESSVSDLGSLGAARQRDDLRQLALLASAATPAPVSPSPSPEAGTPRPATSAVDAGPADQLAAWLLAQADLEEAP